MNLGQNSGFYGVFYPYGFNGMESDDEVKGEKNSYTTEFRQYDPRIGRWLSLDPMMTQFPWLSPYVAFNNNPIYFIDPLGLKGEPADGGGDWRNPEKHTGSNISKAIERIGIGDDGGLLQKTTGRIYNEAWICTKNSNYKKDKVYNDQSTKYSGSDLKDKGFITDVMESNDLKDPDSDYIQEVSKTDVKNEFIIRNDYVYHKQTTTVTAVKIGRDEALSVEIRTNVTEEKQYFSKTINNEDKILDVNRYFVRSNYEVKTKKVNSVELNSKMKTLVQNAVKFNQEKFIENHELNKGKIERQGLQDEFEKLEWQRKMGEHLGE